MLSVFHAVLWFGLHVIVVSPDHTHFFVFDQALPGYQIGQSGAAVQCRKPQYWN